MVAFVFAHRNVLARRHALPRTYVPTYPVKHSWCSLGCMHSSVQLTIHAGQEHAPTEFSSHAVDDGDVVRRDLTHRNGRMARGTRA